ncbi:hypothetical protein CAI21_18410 [Alkalilimnicola ehrlichii]|uniref:Uncharacterized protein n=1 Tax=Alkalilimnicola ehrlichii TaxID=351052 RepID=A0A3E0WLL4_9GAMM|nr:hypothetical protein [Alkalilimnicola ehrlichii]RFA25742.1 hypothetical protein CAI21_18410 [Alkalilimnicola ehrlichii]RFA32825.1 hypothetical protein CAL65_18660 [Alkalilimnicola ehrlichii]
MLRLFLACLLAVSVSACDQLSQLIPGDRVQIEAPGDDVVGDNLQRLIEHLAPDSQVYQVHYGRGVWTIRTRNKLTEQTRSSIEEHIQSFSQASPLNTSLTDLQYQFILPENISEEAASILAGNKEGGFRFSIPTGTIPTMERTDYRVPAIAGIDETRAVCFLEIPIEGSIPAVRYTQAVDIDGSTSQSAEALIRRPNTPFAIRVHGHGIPAKVIANNNRPIEKLSFLEAHYRHDDRLYVSVSHWTIRHRMAFGGSPSSCFRRNGGEKARQRIGQIGFPELIGLPLTMREN